jgi:hypothetical protein
MAYAGTFNLQWASGGTNKSCVITKSSTGRVQCEENVVTASTDFKITLPTVDVSECVAIFILSTQDVLLETNSGTPGAGVDALTLKANEPYVWWKNAPFTNVLVADIETGVYITNASGATATVTLEFILDTTP